MNTRKILANAIRALSMDAIEKANSGHPGAPMGMADIAEVLWRDFLIHNPNNPHWPNRDRFVLSNGHGSMLLYSLLHLSGYDLSIEDLKQFRQLGSKTPGHPELGYTPGVETTTGPLGQGIANAVGMALAEKLLSASFNRDQFNIVDHFTYCFVGDGCLMEGVSHEVCSLAGTHKLGKLIVIWDDNGISIDGEVKGWFTDDTPKRFESYGWQVIENVDGHSSDDVAHAITCARAVDDKPTLICAKTIIGYGAPNKSNSAGVHGSPLGEEELNAAKKELNWTHPPFEIPDPIYTDWNAREKGQQNEDSWTSLFEQYKEKYPELAAEFQRRVVDKRIPDSFTSVADEFIHQCQQTQQAMPTRKASQMTIDFFIDQWPELIGGSADLSGSNLTKVAASEPLSPDSFGGNYIYYGVREFGMSAIMNGMALHGGVVPYGGTFLMFMEYARNAIRMASLMSLRNIFVFTHDSIGQGEDGPTHQPVEQLTNLRTTPNMEVWRPCDLTETAVAWKQALIRQNGPSSLVLTRQKTNVHKRCDNQIENIAKGGYILSDCDQTPDVILMSTGSEVDLAIEAKNKALALGLNIRVVSMPSTTLFDQQDEQYRNQVLPPEIESRIAIEAAHSDFWRKYVGLKGKVIGLDTYGESGPGDVLMAHFGFTSDNIVSNIQSFVCCQ